LEKGVKDYGQRKNFSILEAREKKMMIRKNMQRDRIDFDQFLGGG